MPGEVEVWTTTVMDNILYNFDGYVIFTRTATIVISRAHN